MEILDFVWYGDIFLVLGWVQGEVFVVFNSVGSEKYLPGIPCYKTFVKFKRKF